MKLEYNSDFYKNLKKPKFQPPAWIFAPAWSILYVMMLASLLLVIGANPSPLKLIAYLLFCIQLILNLSWSPLFFGLHKIKEALIVCISLTITVAITTLVFYKISILSAILLLPYFFWLCFASILNFSIVKLNRGELND